MPNIFFTADLHINHKNILRHQKGRIQGMNLKDEEDIEGHDKYVEDMWLSMTKRNDQIYVLGDFIMANSEITHKILSHLKQNGCRIHLIVGNHDKSTHNLTNMFSSISYLKTVTFKKGTYDFLDENFEVVMSHYPMITWQDKPRGSMQLYGHVHSNSLHIDDREDLMLNVGLDNPLSEYKLFSLEKIYSYYKTKLNGLRKEEYIKQCVNNNKFFVK